MNKKDKTFIVKGSDLFVVDSNWNSEEMSAKTTKFGSPEFFKSFDSHKEAVAYARDYYKQNNPKYTDCMDAEDDLDEI